MKKAPENRLNIKFAQELINALRDIEQRLGKDVEGAVIIKGRCCTLARHSAVNVWTGNDAKFWCTVC